MFGGCFGRCGRTLGDTPWFLKCRVRATPVKTGSHKNANKRGRKGGRRGGRRGGCPASVVDWWWRAPGRLIAVEIKPRSILVQASRV